VIDRTDRRRHHFARIWKLTAMSALLVPILVSTAYGQVEIRTEKEPKITNDQLERQAAQLAAQRTDLEQRIGELQRQLESFKTGAAPPPVDAMLRVFSLAHVRPKDAASAIAPLLGGGKIRLSAIDQANILIVAGTKEQLEVAAHLIKEIDRPSGRAGVVQLRLVWIAGKLPQDVGVWPSKEFISTSALNGIARLGDFGDVPKVVCQQVVTVALRTGERSVFRFETPVAIGENRVLFEGSGSVMADVRSIDPPNLDLNVGIHPFRADSAQPSEVDKSRSSTIACSITLPVQHYVIMGVTNLVLGDVKPGDESPKTYPIAVVALIEPSQIHRETPATSSTEAGTVTNADPFGQGDGKSQSKNTEKQPVRSPAGK
jgi:hypothetical protein